MSLRLESLVIKPLRKRQSEGYATLQKRLRLHGSLAEMSGVQKSPLQDTHPSVSLSRTHTDSSRGETLVFKLFISNKKHKARLVLGKYLFTEQFFQMYFMTITK